MGETRETLAVPRGVTFVTETMLHKTKENVTNVINRLCNLHKNRNRNKLFHSPTMLTSPRFQKGLGETQCYCFCFTPPLVPVTKDDRIRFSPLDCY